MMSVEKLVLDSASIDRALVRMAHEIFECHKDPQLLAVVGIRTRGVYLAERLQKKLHEITGTEIPLGTLDITMYRDDLSEVGPNPEVRETKLPFDLNKRVVLLVDDVLYTGRTIRAALDALNDYGRPKMIQLAVLVDRGHRELPIRADYVGKNVPTSVKERVIIRIKEVDGKDEAVVTGGNGI